MFLSIYLINKKILFKNSLVSFVKEKEKMNCDIFIHKHHFLKEPLFFLEFNFLNYLNRLKKHIKIEI